MSFRVRPVFKSQNMGSPNSNSSVTDNDLDSSQNSSESGNDNANKNESEESKSTEVNASVSQKTNVKAPPARSSIFRDVPRRISGIKGDGIRCTAVGIADYY